MTSSRSAADRVTTRLAGQFPLADTYHSAVLAQDMARITPEVSELVSESTGLDLPGDPSTAVISRIEWVERNVASFQHLIEPATSKLIDSRGDGSAKAEAMERVVQRETSAVLGFLSRRVLGQYELVLPTGDDGDSVVYVGANLLQMERTHQFRPEEFRFWVALHELTHRAQFVGVHWLRDYFRSLVEELVEASSPVPGQFKSALNEVFDRLMNKQPVVDERGIFGLIASDEQTNVVDRIQALMTLLEGHGHVVMDRIGAERLRSQDRMSRVLKNRRKDKRTAAFFRLTGLEMKINQYENGARFIKAVEREAGWETLRLAFRGASSLPTIEEIRDPHQWLVRVA